MEDSPPKANVLVVGGDTPKLSNLRYKIVRFTLQTGRIKFDMIETHSSCRLPENRE